MLTYCHAPARSCSWLIPCEDRALTIRGFPRPAPCREGCKGFWRADPSPTSPRVAMEIAPLPRHRSTFSASSEDLARPRWEGAVTTASTAPALLPIEGANKVLGELTQSQFVPGEGKTPQFDERTLPAGQRGAARGRKTIPHKTSIRRHLPSLGVPADCFDAIK